MAVLKRLIVNADDVGLHPAIDDAVAALAGARIVTSASVMTLGSPAPATLAAIMAGGASLGLHLDLTSTLAQARYGGRRTLPRTMLDAWRYRFDSDRLRALIAGQLQRFGELAGRPPDFVDGHEHVHQFPQIREALLVALAACYPGRRIPLRDTRPRHWRGAKAALIGKLGAAQLARLAAAAGHAGNRDFAGVYDLGADADLAALWDGWLRSLPVDGALAMCHPGFPHAASEPFRAREFAFLAGARFQSLLAEHRVTAVPWPAG